MPLFRYISEKRSTWESYKINKCFGWSDWKQRRELPSKEFYNGRSFTLTDILFASSLLFVKRNAKVETNLGWCFIADISLSTQFVWGGSNHNRPIFLVFFSQIASEQKNFYPLNTVNLRRQLSIRFLSTVTIKVRGCFYQNWLVFINRIYTKLEKGIIV